MNTSTQQPDPQQQREPLTDQQWLKRWTGKTGQRLKPGPERDRLLRIFRFSERAHGIGPAAAAPQPTAADLDAQEQHRTALQAIEKLNAEIGRVSEQRDKLVEALKPAHVYLNGGPGFTPENHKAAYDAVCAALGIGSKA